MANIFISYARSSEGLVRRIAEALGAAGHEVWTDAELPPHRAYADVIEERLGAADAVLVLWSADATHSQWVRAEAEHARGRSRLVQATIDGVLPPMPFNQIQCASLENWRGDPNAPGWRKVLDSLTQLGAIGGAVAAPSVLPPPPGPGHKPRWLLAGAAVAGVIALIVGFMLLRHPDAAAAGPARVAVLPMTALSETPVARDAAKAVSDELFAMLNSNAISAVSQEDAQTLRGPDRLARMKELGVSLLLGGTVRDDGKTVDINTYLEDPVHHATLWTSSAQGAAGDVPDLRAQVAKSAANVLACSNRAFKPGGLTDPALLVRYLHACDLFANHQDAGGVANTFQLLSSLRQVIKGAPDFVPAHTDLAKFSAYLAPTMPPEAAPAMRAEAAREADAALAIDPRSPDAWLAREMLLPRTAWAAREAALRKGLAIDPDWPHTNGFLSFLLQETGRMKEAEVHAARAAAADLQIDWSPQGRRAACNAGDFEPATSDMQQALEADSGNEVARYTLQSCLFDAGKIERGCALFLPESAPPGSSWQLFCKAATTRASSDRAAAVHSLIETAAKGGASAMGAISRLAQLGELDEAFRIADTVTNGYPINGGSIKGLFSVRSANFYRDPRFIAFAARLKLVDFWRASGKWPDFCKASGLPYDCKREADRVRAAPDGR